MKNFRRMTPFWQMAATVMRYGYGSDKESTCLANDNNIVGDNELNWYVSLTSTMFDIETMISMGDSY